MEIDTFETDINQHTGNSLITTLIFENQGGNIMTVKILKEKYWKNMRCVTTEQGKFVLFWGNNQAFSNFYEKEFDYEGRTLKYSEQAFMIEKAKLFEPAKIEAIANAKNPAEAKYLGRKIQNFDDKVWNEKRFDAMVKALKAKFQDTELKNILLATEGATLIEASPYDKIWGTGYHVKDNRNFEQPIGQNLLGKALMHVRNELKN